MKKQLRKYLLSAVTLVSAFGVTSLLQGQTAYAQDTLNLVKKEYNVAWADASKGSLASLQSAVNAAAKERVSFETTYDTLLVGGAIKVNAVQAKAIARIPGVVISLNQTYSAPEVSKDDDIPAEQDTDYPNFAQETMDVKEYENVSKKGEGIKIGILDTGLFYDQVQRGEKPDSTTSAYPAFVPLTGKAYTDDNASTAYTQSEVESLMAKENTKPGYYVNSKIIFEYDYGDNDDSVSPLVGQEHGTHVASLAAANGSQYTGIAPNAQLAIMKVFNSTTSGADDKAIIAALEDAAKLGLDEVNLSLGLGLYDVPDFQQYDLVRQAANALRNKGTIVNYSAGNDGREQFSDVYGNFVTLDTVESSILGESATYDSANSIASSYPVKSRVSGIVLSNDPDNVIPIHDQNGSKAAFDSLFGSEHTRSVDYLVVGGSGLGKNEDYAKVDVKGKIAVVNRGEITFVNKALFAQQHGAAGLIIVNTDNSDLNIQLSDAIAIPVATLSLDTGKVFADHPSGKLSYQTSPMPSAKVGTVSEFSSDGATTDLRLKPDIAAPGSAVMGAYHHGYQEESGTSMAAPNLTGALALLLGEHTGSATELAKYKQELMARVQSTATILKDSNANANDKMNFASVRLQGAGQIDVDKAATSPVYVWDDDASYYDGQTLVQKNAKIEFQNKLDFSKDDFSAQLKAYNGSDEPASYNVSVHFALPEAQTVMDTTAFNGFTGDIKDHVSGNLVNAVMKSTNVVEVGTYEYPQTFTFQPGENNFYLPAFNPSELFSSLTSYANKYYKNGTTLEGFVVLTPTKQTVKDVDGASQLNVPFLGFYGDYGKADATEPFDFEKASGMAYNSDLLNLLTNAFVGASNPYADYGSHIYGTSKITGANRDAKMANAFNALANSWGGYQSLADSIGAVKLGTEFNASKITAGVPGLTDQLVIQLNVQRTVQAASVTLYENGASHRVISTTPIYSYPSFGNDGDEESVQSGDLSGLSKALTKSFITQSGISSGYFAPMAGTFVELKDSDGNALADGDYTLEFDYTLAAKDKDGNNYVQRHNVPLTISKAAPTYQGASNIGSGYNIYVSQNAAYVVYNKKQYDILTDGNGNDFAFIPNTDLAASGPYLVTIVGANASKADVLIDLAANGNYALIGNTDTVSAIYVEKKALDKGYEYSVHALNQIGLDDQNFLSDASRKVMVNIGKNVRLDTVYVLDAEGNQTVLSESDYVYDPATGFISISGFGVGAVTFGYTFF